MLQIAPQSSCFSSSYSKSKCAEIHYHSTTFSILCIFCGMKTNSYEDFCIHFHKHNEDFSIALPTTEELSLNDVNYSAETNFHGNHDPLKLEVSDVTNDSGEALNILRTENNEIKKVKCAEKRMLDEEQYVSEMILEQQKIPFNNVESMVERGKELVKPKIKLEDASISNNKNAENIFLNSTNNKGVNSESCEKLSETDSDQLDSISTLADNENADVDWSKSCEPNSLKNNSKRPYKARYTPNMCTYCGKTFRRRLQLDTHINIHTGSKPHQCEICGRQFRAITTLARHRNTHKHHDVFNCKFCAKSFSRRAAMLSHELRHTQERRIPCDECEKHFYTVNQMDTHKRKVHNKADDATLPFQCDLCTKRYRTASMLSTHKFKKHYKTANIFCEQCGKKFADEQQLATHKMIHTCSIGSS